MLPNHRRIIRSLFWIAAIVVLLPEYIVCQPSGMIYARRLGYHRLITFTYDEQDVLAGYTLMDSYVDRTVASWITGETELNDETWAAYDRYNK